MDKNPWLTKASFTFSQDGNTNGTTTDYEELIIDIESSEDIREGHSYFVIRTSTGWSISTPDEIYELIEHVTEKIPSTVTPHL